MSWVPLSKTQHSEKALVKEKNFKFIEREIITDLFNFEFETAISCIPIFFAEGQKGIRTVGLMGLEKNKNLFVEGGGMWKLPHFIPATIASFPFRALTTEDEKNIIVFKDDSDSIVDRAEGIPLFDKEGKETAVLKRHLGLVSKIINAQKIIKVVVDQSSNIITLIARNPTWVKSRLACLRRTRQQSSIFHKAS